MAKLDVPVLIVGGGGAGLTASMLLSKLGVESLLLSALPATSILPKAHVLNQRCMEVYTDFSVAGGGRSAVDLLEDLRSFYFETALFGSDWPYAPTPVVSYFTSHFDAYGPLDAAGHAAIDRGNAHALFPSF